MEKGKREGRKKRRQEGRKNVKIKQKLKRGMNE